MANIPDLLYKYRSLQDNYTLRNIKNHLLYFSHPNIFNDPYDCNPQILDTEYRISHQTKLYIHDGASMIPAECISGSLNISYDLQKRISQQILNRYSICCFSSISDSILMWSHYADYHRGICLVFKPKEDMMFFKGCAKVVYSKYRANYSLGNNNTHTHLITKHIDWQYESEYRIIELNTSLSLDDNYQPMVYNHKALAEIIFGAKTDETNINNIICMCQDIPHLQHITFSKMVLDDTAEYKLKKVKL